LALPPLVRPKDNSIIRIQHITSSQYIGQTHGANRDDKRNVTVWPLPKGKANSLVENSIPSGEAKLGI
jgi:hypothetical protein